MSIFNKVILKICIILMGGLILFHIVFASSKGYYHKYSTEYSQGGVRLLPSNLTEKQYFTTLAHADVRVQLTLLSDYKYNPNYLFGLPENTIYFIYSGYFFLLMVFIIFYSGSLFGRAEVRGKLKRQPPAETQQTSKETATPAEQAEQLPVDKDGNVLWDELLKQDPEKFVSEYSKKYGDKETKDEILYVVKNVGAENLKLKDKLLKAKTITDRRSIKDKIIENESYIQQLKQADESIKTPEKTPVETTQEVKQPEVTNQSPDVGKKVEEKPVIKENLTTEKPKEQPKEIKLVEPKKPVKKRVDNSVIAKSLRIDPTTPDEIALQYFIGDRKSVV